MKKFVLAAMILTGAAILFSGCSSLEVAKKLNNVSVTEGNQTYTAEHYTYSNYGFYFLNCVPVFSGTVIPDNAFALFTDTVNTESAVHALTNSARKAGAFKVLNMTTSTDSRYNFWTLFFWTRSVQVSATVISE